MLDYPIKQQLAQTPAFVVDQNRIDANLQPLLHIRQHSGCKILYSVKALPLGAVLEQMQTQIDGFAVSSLYEAKLAKEIIPHGEIHLTTPGLRTTELSEHNHLCSHISFNSWSQYQRTRQYAGAYAIGLRVNPQLSFSADQRYDPCRPHSKLGIRLHDLPLELPTDVSGLHVHHVFSQLDFHPLSASLTKIQPWLQANPQLQWLNLGGGYLYHAIANLQPIIQLIQQLKAERQVDVFLEPGKAIVGNAGYLISSVIDRFDSDGKTVLVLDTSINHHPEVFEYQMSPPLQEASAAKQGYSALLAGSTCLAGDLFGEYYFKQLPEIGDRLTFCNSGAYTLIKANRFNGYNLPDVYLLKNQQLQLLKQDSYADYRRQWYGAGATAN